MCKSSNYCEAFLEGGVKGAVLGEWAIVVLVILYRVSREEVLGIILGLQHRNNTWSIRNL